MFFFEIFNFQKKWKLKKFENVELRSIHLPVTLSSFSNIWKPFSCFETTLWWFIHDWVPDHVLNVVYEYVIGVKYSMIYFGMRTCFNSTHTSMFINVLKNEHFLEYKVIYIYIQSVFSLFFFLYHVLWMWHKIGGWCRSKSLLRGTKC